LIVTFRNPDGAPALLGSSLLEGARRVTHHLSTGNINMKAPAFDSHAVQTSTEWLERYYIGRFAFSAVWVALAFTVGKSSPAIAAVMLVLYPAWDAFTNIVDAQRSGGLTRNKTQLLNAIVSGVTAVGVGITLGRGTSAVVVVFGVWAALSGLLQLATALRRWKSFGAQWAMILSGAQSAVAGVLFVQRAGAPDISAVTTVAPYAAVGAFYFLISGIWLAVSEARRSDR
jgi:uncharacterized membrane protein HdeD (DUF308 family)